MALHRPRLRAESVSENASVTPLELFFDLVFVFALTQVTAQMADDLTAHGMVRGVLIVALLWWSWTGYAWLSNVVKADEGGVRLVMLAAMTAMFILALTIPEAFVDIPGGLSGPVVLAVCYFVFRLMHLVMFWIIARDDPALHGQIVRFTPSVLGGTLLLLAASQYTGVAQTWIWAAALAADYFGTMLGGSEGWRLNSAAHFAERHGLILIVALGESIVAIGVGVAEKAISWPVVVASILGLALAAAVWWVYFDMSALHAERALAAEPVETRPRLARDAYSYLHLPLIAGIVLVALGMKKVLEYVADTDHHELSDALTGTGLYALYGGVAVYLLAHVAFKWRLVHQVQVDRLVCAVLVVVLAPVAETVPALAALGIITAVVVGLIVFETVRYAEHRERIRHAEAHPPGEADHPGA